MANLAFHIPGLLLVIFRIGGLMVFAPVVSSRAVPVKVRILLAFVIGFAVYPILPQGLDVVVYPTPPAGPRRRDVSGSPSGLELRPASRRAPRA